MLLDQYIPLYHFHEHHSRIINADAKQCFLATKELDMSRSWITKLLMKLRGIPTHDLRLQGVLKTLCFTYIEEHPFEEFVIDASQHDLKIFWNFSFKEISGTATLVSTETRIFCLTPGSKKRFRVYWFFIRPFSGLIRREILRLLERKVRFQKRAGFAQS